MTQSLDSAGKSILEAATSILNEESSTAKVEALQRLLSGALQCASALGYSVIAESGDNVIVNVDTLSIFPIGLLET